jgi:hypothetical protein
MPSLSAADIRNLCDRWCDASTTPGGGTAIGHQTEQFRLLANGIVFHELSHAGVCVALVALSKVLLRPGMNTIVDQDHFGIWSWCGELLLNPRATVFAAQQREIKSLFEASLHAALAHCRKPAASREEWQAQRQAERQLPHHAQQLLHGSSLVLAYLSFPLLEAILKRACASFINLDGTVTTQFQAPRRNGTMREYKPQDQCSSIRDLLHLHHTKAAPAPLRALIDEFKSHIQFLDSSKDAFDLIYQWRNDSLHGTSNYQTIGGTILSLALLIQVFEIETDFEQRRQRAIEHCRWEAQSGHKSPWSFYPPY